MNNFPHSKSKTPLQLKVFHTLLGFAVFFSLITIPAECQTINLFGMHVSSEWLWWPIVFFVLHLIYSIYGFSYLRHSVCLVVLFRLIYLLFLKLAISLPSASFWKMQEIYTHVLDRNFLYMMESSIAIWLCALIPIKAIYIFQRQSNAFIFLGAALLFATLNTVLSNISSAMLEHNLLAVAVIYCFLMAFSSFFIKMISNIEQLKPVIHDYTLLKFRPSSDFLSNDKIFKYHHILFCSSIVFFIASKTMAAKFISIGFITINVGGIVFSLAYLAADIMTDVYGIERTKQMILFVIFSNLLFVFDVWITNGLSINSHSEFRSILHNQARMFFSSGMAFFLGMTINSSVISMIKTRQRKRGISLKKEFITTVWTRVATSSSFGIILDVSLFSLIAFYGLVPSDKLTSIIAFEDVYKISYEILLAPLSVLLIYALKATEKVDIYDELSNLNPFRINTNYKFNANKFHENYSPTVRKNND